MILPLVQCRLTLPLLQGRVTLPQIPKQLRMFTDLLLSVLTLVSQWHMAACVRSREWIMAHVRPIKLKAPYLLIITPSASLPPSD